MGMVIGQHIGWRFQGVKSCCWLTCIEMVMQYKYGNRFGNGQTQHSAAAIAAYNANRGSDIGAHADHYGLLTNERLDSPYAGLHEWRTALLHGPVIATGKYGLGSFGVGNHVIVVVGISRTDKLVYLNPNMITLFTHPRGKESYMSVADMFRLRTPGGGEGPFWQLAEDMPFYTAPQARPLPNIQPNWAAQTNARLSEAG